MSEYISKQEAIEAFSDMSDGSPITHGDMISDTTAVNVIKSISSADVRENIHGHWIEDGHGHIICSACKEVNVSTWKSRFCPMCGCCMKEEKKYVNEQIRWCK